MKLIKFINNKKPLAILTLFNIFIYILVQNHVNSAVKELVRIEREAYQSKCYFPEPSLIYEQKRRRIRSTIENLWSSVRYRIHIKKRFPNFYNDLLRVLKEVYEHKLALLSAWKNMSLNDGYETWRQFEYKNLNRLVESGFKRLMNPTNCSDVKVLYCFQYSTCGWGCQTLHYVQSFALAYALQRYFVFDGTPRSNINGVDDHQKYYEPITETETCNQRSYYRDVKKWPGTDDTNVLQCPLGTRTKTNYTYLSVPQELLPRISKISSMPAVWFNSQIEEFLLKLKPEYKNHIEKTAKELGFEHPIVGVHIESTDKFQETSFKLIEQYMERVKYYFDTLELTQKVDKKRIFLATDEPLVVKKLIELYSNSYEIISNFSYAIEAENSTVRIENPLSIITDINLLARCDHFVGTFSSNVGKRVLEFMYRQNLDAPEKAVSIDSTYSEGSNMVFKYKVLISHKSSKSHELQAEVGDIVLSSDYNLIKGWTKGIIGNSIGLIPSYKIEEIPIEVDFPKFED